MARFVDLPTGLNPAPRGCSQSTLNRGQGGAWKLAPSPRLRGWCRILSINRLRGRVLLARARESERDCERACVHFYACVYACMHACMHVRMHACRHLKACVCVCMYVSTHYRSQRHASSRHAHAPTALLVIYVTTGHLLGAGATEGQPRRSRAGQLTRGNRAGQPLETSAGSPPDQPWDHDAARSRVVRQ